MVADEFSRREGMRFELCMEVGPEDSNSDVPVPLTRRQRGGFWLITLPAAVVPFVSFAPEMSPLRALWEGFRFWIRGGGLPSPVLFVLLAAPFLLGPLIALLQLRLFIAPSLTVFERGFVLAAAAMSGAMTLLFAGLGIVAMVRTEVFSDLHWIVTAVVALVGGGLVCVYGLRGKSASATRPFAALLIAFVANAVICLVGFFDGRQEVGWWLTLVATSGMVVELFVLTRRSRARCARGVA